MEKNEQIKKPIVSSFLGTGILMLALAVPVLFISHIYIDRIVQGRGDEPVTFLTTAFFLLMVITGRYIALIWIDKDLTVSNSAIAGIVSGLGISLILSFVLAEVMVNFDRHFLQILVVGLPFAVFGLTTGMLIKVLQTRIRKRLGDAEVRAEQSTNELRLLQSQLSPHFLFNTLNNMYGLSLTQHEKVPGLLLKLSDLLRYSVYDAKENLVPLKNELAYIKDYIDFEKIRIGDKLADDIFIEELPDPSIKIAPLLLIVFIENAFKHSKNTTDQKIYISITVKTWAGFILFSVRNSLNRTRAETELLPKDGGFGLENVKKRLELQYHGEHDLSIQQGETFYQVNLKLKAK